MTVLVVGSVHGAPGATTTAVALAGCFTGSVLVEADCDGGVLAARFGMTREPGVVTLAADREVGAAGRVLSHSHPAPGGVPVVVGPESADHATWLWRSAGAQLAAALHGHDGVVVVDAGRLRPAAPTIDRFGEALTLLVTRPRADELAVVAARLAEHAGGRRPALVLVGDRPYRPADVEGELGCDVLGVVADDPRGVSALWGGGTRRQLARSAFARSVRSLADAVAVRLERDSQDSLQGSKAVMS